MSTQKACDHCGYYRQNGDGSPAVLRYSLRRDVVESRAKGIRRGRLQVSAGGIDLCSECWGRICAPRMNARKGHRRAVA